MKTLYKNFKTSKVTVETLACSCSCGKVCQCTNVGDYAGYQYIPTDYTASVTASHRA